MIDKRLSMADGQEYQYCDAERGAGGDKMRSAWWRRGGVWTTVGYLVLLVLALSCTPAEAELNLPIRTIDKWASDFGSIIYDVCRKATGLTDLQTDYLLTKPKVHPIDGGTMVRRMKRNMQAMLKKKVKAIKRLVEIAEKAHSEHVYEKRLQKDYPKAKKLNTSEFELIENEHFNYIPVNLSLSTVHVPTNVYDESSEVVNGVAWSEALDEYFRKNYQRDQTLTWQYFGSASGFFRNFPGTEWNTEKYQTHKIDMFDCRTRGWYIQAATSPKDIIILLDASGSMTGLRMEIAKATVEKILDTLSDDDYFNIIKFSDKPAYVDDCFNHTLVQANADNKKRMKESIRHMQTKDIAQFDLALIEAFELLREMNQTGRGTLCNRAIMLITDGAPETYEHIFKKYNWPERNVRVFTYLIGREVGDSKQVKWMACANKGYYSPISTLADVQEKVQEYIHVISRPMVIKRKYTTTWTSVYSDAANYVRTVSRPMVIAKPNKTIWTPVYMSADGSEEDEALYPTFSPPLSNLTWRESYRWFNSIAPDPREEPPGLRMMTSVAQPVFDRRNETIKDGILLGVMGTDVPLKELVKLTPEYKLGVNGYSFAITNNGYLLFHPDFRPMQGKQIKPNYNSVDLAEVELEDGLDESNFTFEEEPGKFQRPNFNSKLRNKMIDRETGSLRMKVRVHYDNMKRVSIRENNYFFTSIEDTPFSLGIALPDGYGMNWLDGRRRLDDSTDLRSFKSSEVKIADWNYCRMETNETRQEPLEMLLRYLEYGKKQMDIYDDKCDNELIESLLYDADATRVALVNWMKENRDGMPNDNRSRSNCTTAFSTCTPDFNPRNGIELVFIGTKGGLTRYYYLTENATDPNFIDNNKNTIQELYYKRAVEGGESVFTFAIPFNAGEEFEWNKTVVTASSPITIQEEGREAVAAVVGLQMRYDKFYEFFINQTRVCPRGGDQYCNLTCESPALDCYLLDNNGFVILSENQGEIGKFFGDLDGTLMKKLIQHDEIPDVNDNLGIKKGVFKRVQMHDYQGLCEIWVRGGSGASTLFINPLKKLFSSLSWIVQEIAMFLVQFNLFSWWSSGYTTVRGDEFVNIDLMEDLIGRILDDLRKFGSEEQVFEWKNQLFGSTVDYTNREEVMEWYGTIKKQYGPRLTGYESCAKEFPLFLADFEALPHYNTLNKCGWCSRSYSIHRVVKTNLMLLAVDAQCYCIMDPPISIVPVKVEYNDTMMCQRLQQDIYRKRPDECHSYHVEEDSTHCSSCQQRYSPWLVLVLLLIAIFSSQTRQH